VRAIIEFMEDEMEGIRRDVEATRQRVERLQQREGGEASA
jgi:hypothetical protein